MNDPRNPASPTGNPAPHPLPPQQTIRPPQPSPGIGAPRPAPAAPRPATAAGDAPIALVEELSEAHASPTPVPSKIKFGPDIVHKKHDWKRKPHLTGTGACRMKSFHAKYSDQGLEHLD